MLFVGVKIGICNESVLKDAVSLVEAHVVFLSDQMQRMFWPLDMAGIFFLSFFVSMITCIVSL